MAEIVTIEVNDKEIEYLRVLCAEPRDTPPHPFDCIIRKVYEALPETAVR